MLPNYNRRSDSSGNAVAQREPNVGREDAVHEDAAEAIRAAEIEAVQPLTPREGSSRLEDMSIDELRKIAAKLDIPDRGQIVEQDQLIAEIRQRL